MNRILAAALLIALVPLNVHAAQSPDDKMLALVNKARAEAGLSALVRNPLLDAAASAKAADMVKRDYFSHDTPDGQSPWVWFTSYAFAHAGENLARGFRSPYAAHDALMASPTHRANLLSQLYTEVGISFEGRTVVQHFGRPL
jgi:uncharacterized protein YkwD